MRSVLLVSLLAIGCSDTPTSRKPGAKPIDDSAPQEKLPAIAIPKPAKTDPDAESTLASLLLKHTNNNLAALAAFKTCIVKRTGEMNAGGNTMLPTVCTDCIQWPDCFRADWVMNNEPMMYLGFHGVRNWQFAPKMDREFHLIDANLLPVVIADRDATLMTLMIPLIEASDRVAMPVPASEMAEGLKGVRVWVRDMAPMVLGIDAKSGLLSRVYFEKTEVGRTATWAFHLKDHKAVQGVQMPHRVTYSGGKQIGAEWTTITYELPNSINVGLFDKP
ncbi:hypothetical protein BH11PLA2_BH11PLA2_01510 [soil metagenome]